MIKDMFWLLALLFIPLLEIAVFIKLGQYIGVPWALGLTLLTAAIGVLLLRAQGAAATRRAMDSLLRDKFPVEEIFDALCMLVAGAFLLTPGFVTDMLGFLLFVPPFRHFVFQQVKKSQSARFSAHAVYFDNVEEGEPEGPATIEGEYREIDRKDLD